MKLSIKYFLLIGILHIGLAIALYFSLYEHKAFFILAEIALGITFFYSYKIYKNFTEPLKFIQRGTDAIKDEDFNITYAHTGTKEIDSLIEVFNEMIHRIRKERVSIKEQHFFLEKLIDASPNGIILFDFDDNVTSINPFAKKLLNIDGTIKSLSSIDHPIVNAILKLESGEDTVVKLDGWQQFKCHVSHIIHQGFKRKFVIIENLSSEILKSEKQAYGKIIRMMAHEVNNSMGAINSILETVKEINAEMEFEQNEDVSEALNVAIKRNSMLGEFMKNFAEVVRLPQPHMAQVDLVDLSQRMITLFKPQLSNKNIDIACQLPKSPVYVHVDQTQIEQVLVNVLKNAMEAIESDGKIELEVMERGSILIKDNGKGISPEVEEKIFQPFYSSKPQGQGIGLTLIKEILLRHNSYFSLKTYSEGLTIFQIDFFND